MRFLSLGAGVQSTTLALMASRGVLSPPDHAIFADTGWEPKAVYAHLDWLATQLTFPLHRVSSGDIRQNILDRRNTTGGRYAAIPWFIVNPDGSRGMGRRQCSSEYKLKPIMWKMRDLLGVSRRGHIKAGTAEVWIGISTDEATRMKPARQAWQKNRWPLIELGMSRQACLTWLKEHGYPTPPKSACIGCPFHNDAMWRDLRDHSPEEWADAVAMDRRLREGDARGFRGQEFMHAQRVPLDQVKLRGDDEKHQLNLFENECEGICGV
jgi:hypothetical protein